MAYQMIHLEVAYRLLPFFPSITVPSAFILGVIAPDSVHTNPDYQVEMKIHSHLFQGCGPWGDTRDYEQWILNIKDFWQKMKPLCNDEEYCFLAGICVHCLTDYCNDLMIWRKLQHQYESVMDMETFRADFYPEARGIDQWLYHNSPNKDAIWELFAKSNCMDLHGFLNLEEVISEKHHLLCVQYDTKPEDCSNYKYVSKEFLEDFLQNAVHFIKDGDIWH